MRTSTLRIAAVLLSIALTLGSHGLPALAFMAWFSLVPMLWAFDGAGPWARAGLGFLYGLGVTAALSDGLVHSLYFHLGLSELIAWAAIALPYAAFLALFSALFAVLSGVIASERAALLLRPIACACLWVSIEWLRGHAFIGFPFALHGHSQFQQLWLIQIADLGGVYAVSFVLVLVNQWLALLLTGSLSRTLLLRSGCLIMLLVLACAVYGQLRLHALRDEAFAPVLVGLVNADVSQGAEEEPDTRVELLWRKLHATQAALARGARLVVWPETSHYSAIEDRVPWRIEYALGKDADLVIGAVRGDASRGDDLRTNSAFLVQRGFVTARYDKRKLFPFGEYDPTRGMPWIEGKFPPLAQLIEGGTPGVLPSRVGKLGVLICFEALYPELSAEAVRAGAELLVVMANDAWFGSTLTNQLTPAMLTFRAVEMRRSLVRAANRGATGSVAATGASTLRFDLGPERVALASVRLHRELSFYARFGDLFSLLCLLGLGGVVWPWCRDQSAQLCGRLPF